MHARQETLVLKPRLTHRRISGQIHFCLSAGELPSRARSEGFGPASVGYAPTMDPVVVCLTRSITFLRRSRERRWNVPSNCLRHAPLQTQS